jgi:precorrin-2 dehydrogenase/sirohydrochlorin ferrochelatase
VKYYPVFLNLHGQKAVVIGGGEVAERKVIVLMKAGATVKIISPDITKNLQRLVKKRQLSHIKRPYRKGDLKDTFIVIAGTSSEQTNAQIAKDAKHLVNVIDTPSEGNFIAPSLVSRGRLQIAVSTEGSSPAVSKNMRKELETLYGPEFTRYLRFLETMRKKAMKEIKDDKKRGEYLKSLASDKIFKALRKNGASCLTKIIPAP